LVTASWALPLCRVAERALAIAPDERFSDALEFSSAIVAAAGARLTTPEPALRSRRAARPESPPQASRWRSATPFSLVLDLPPPLLDADLGPADMGLTDLGLDSERAAPPLATEQPALSPHWQRWQPVLAALAAVVLALSAWRLMHRPLLGAAQQPPAAQLPPPPATQLRPAPIAATAPVTLPPGSAPHAVPLTRRPAPPKSRPRSRLDADPSRDYGI